MKKVIITILITIVLILTLGMAGYVGYSWYRDNHIFVEGTAYSIHAESLDLREEDISVAHYDAVHSQLPNCDILWMVPFRGGKYASDTRELTLDGLSREDMQRLSYFPGLQRITANMDDYAILEELQALRPELEVVYTVDIGGTPVAPDTAQSILSPGSFVYDALMENLVHLPAMEHITFQKSELTTEQLDALREAYPEIVFACTVEILGQEYDMETTSLDLSNMTSADVETVAAKLTMLPNLESVELMKADGSCNLTSEEVKTLITAAPDAVYNFAFEFFGQTLTSADEEVIFKNTKIGDENEAALRLALDLLPNCKRFVLDNCHFSDEVLAKVRDDYRHQTKVVWRVWFGEGSTLTDAEMIRAVYKLVDDNCHDLVYCEDVRYIDFGHNEYLDTCEFVSGMVNLEAIILSGSPIKDLSPFANCKKLKFLEIAFCEYITDVTPLSNCVELEMLNISNTHVLDLSPLDELPLTHLVARINPSGKCRIPAEEQERFIQQHPDCWSSFEGAQPYGAGWRYTENEKDYLPWYAMLRDLFRYDIFPKTPNHVGWYFSEEEKAEYGL